MSLCSTFLVSDAKSFERRFLSVSTSGALASVVMDVEISREDRLNALWS